MGSKLIQIYKCWLDHLGPQTKNEDHGFIQGLYGYHNV